MITIQNITKKYGDFTAVNNLSFNVKEGEILCLLGANGAGKSTTINMLLNFTNPSSGTAEINGLDVVKNPIKTKEFLTYIPENLMLYPTLTAIENLDYFTKLSGKKFDTSELQLYLTEAGLQEEAHNKRVKTFSKGMRQKVGIALAIAKESKVLLLDEPTSGLDPKSSNEFMELLTKMKNEGVAILMATHDLFRAKEVSTHIGIMCSGVLENHLNTPEVSLKELETIYLDIMNFKNVS
ncbi:ABC transporter ATP-binding protein [Tenacibaculum holothuriorum]|uniref:ABC transporter ATP-binding protein n=1 Tax=Tenacibaculum holothuriorum TaxID=1635173 RepID=A0A1Y2PFL6_9FLAO|nr:ABC transporter ATP-binding protein [Tenacibaculum holothuriorum]OSY89274.1 ABC transporter ATP-binding protein [Tenacibaculum holothuriorum]